MADPCPSCAGVGLHPLYDTVCLLCGGRGIDPDGPQPRRALCPSCHRLVHVDSGGDLTWHRTGPTRDEPMCGASFSRPEEPECANS